MEGIGPDGKVYRNIPEGTNLEKYGLRPLAINPPPSSMERFGETMDSFVKSGIKSAVSGPLGSRIYKALNPTADEDLARIEARAAELEPDHPDASRLGSFAGDLASPESYVGGKILGAIGGKIKNAIQTRQLAKAAPKLNMGKFNLGNEAERGLAESFLTKPGAELAADTAGAAAKPAVGAGLGGAAGYGMAGPYGAELGAALGSAIGGQPIRHTIGGFLTMPLSAMQQAAMSRALRYQGAKAIPPAMELGGRLAVPPFLKDLLGDPNGTESR